MKIHEYNEMMAYLTRPATRQPVTSGGRIGFLEGGVGGGFRSDLYGDASNVKKLRKYLIEKIKNKDFRFESNMDLERKFKVDTHVIAKILKEPQFKKLIKSPGNLAPDKTGIVKKGGKIQSISFADKETKNAIKKIMEDYMSKPRPPNPNAESLSSHIKKLQVYLPNLSKDSVRSFSNFARGPKGFNLKRKLVPEGTFLPRPGGSSVSQNILRDIVKYIDAGGEDFKFAKNGKANLYRDIKIIDKKTGDLLTENTIKNFIKNKDSRFINYAKVFEESNFLKKIKYINPISKEKTTLLQALEEMGFHRPIHRHHIENVTKNPLKIANVTWKQNQDAKKIMSAPEAFKSGVQTVDKSGKIVGPKISPDKFKKDIIKFTDRMVFRNLGKKTRDTVFPNLNSLSRVTGASKPELSNFSKAVREIQNKVGSTPVDDFMKLGIAQSKDIGNFVKKYGLGAAKVALKGIVIATPAFVGMEIADASRKYEEGESTGQIVADIAGNWIVPGIGGAYDAEEKNKLMKNIARPEELEALNKYNRYRSGQKMAEGAIEFGEEEAAAQQMSENVSTPEEQLNLFKLLEKGEAADFYNKQRRKGERAELAEESIDTFSNLENFSAADGGRVGFAEGTSPDLSLPPVYDSTITGGDPTNKEPFSQFFINFIMDQNQKGYMSEKDIENLISGKNKKGMDSIFLEYKKYNPEKLSGFSIGTKPFGDEKGMFFKFSKRFNQGGRVGFAEGPKDPSKRLFIKGLAALSVLPVVGKYFKLAPKAKQAAGVILEKASGIPEWFQPFVNKVLKEGKDVTKTEAIADRQIVKRVDIEDATVDVHYDVATNDVRVEVVGGKTAFDEPLEMQYKAPEVLEESGKKTKAEFSAAESRPRATGPDDIELDSVETDILDDLLSETDYLEGYATGKIRTPLQIKKARERAKLRQDAQRDPYSLLEDIDD